ncbi:MAG: DUF6580 family putative transport protein [Ignavibacteriaceae bacterium]
MKKIFSNQFVIVFALIVLISISKLIPGGINFEPVLAVLLFAGAYVSSKKSALLLLPAFLLLTDIIIYSNGGYEFFTILTLSVYLSYTLIILMGIKLKSDLSFRNVIITSIAACLLFFVITNFTAWADGSCGLYSKDLTGLLDAFSAALFPYFTDSIISTLLYSGVLFGTAEYLKHRSVLHAAAN